MKKFIFPIVFAVSPFALATERVPFAKCTTEPYGYAVDYTFYSVNYDEQGSVITTDALFNAVEIPAVIGFRDWITFKIQLRDGAHDIVFEFSNYLSPSQGVMRIDGLRVESVPCELL